MRNDTYVLYAIFLYPVSQWGLVHGHAMATLSIGSATYRKATYEFQYRELKGLLAYYALLSNHYIARQIKIDIST